MIITEIKTAARTELRIQPNQIIDLIANGKIINYFYQCKRLHHVLICLKTQIKCFPEQRYIFNLML